MVKTGKSSQIDCRFCVTSPAKHSLVLCIEGVDVAWSAEVCGLAIGVCKCADSGGSVVCADSSCAAIQEVYCHGERCAQHTCVFFHLMIEFKFCCATHCDRGTEHSSAVSEHEVDLFRCYHFCSRDEVTLILAVFIVNHDDELPFPEIVESRFDGAQLYFVIVLFVVHISVLIFLR